MTSASSVHEAGHSKPVLWDNPEGWGGKGGGKGVQDGREEGSGWGDASVHVTDSCQCMQKPPQDCKAIKIN